MIIWLIGVNIISMVIIALITLPSNINKKNKYIVLFFISLSAIINIYLIYKRHEISDEYKDVAYDQIGKALRVIKEPFFDLYEYKAGGGYIKNINLSTIGNNERVIAEMNNTCGSQKLTNIVFRNYGTWYDIFHGQIERGDEMLESDIKEYSQYISPGALKDINRLIEKHPGVTGTRNCFAPLFPVNGVKTYINMIKGLETEMRAS